MERRNTLKNTILVLFLVTIVSIPLTTKANVFLRILKQGDKGADVLLLQKVLNSFQDLQIAVTGAGSPGKETSFFGEATKKAVIRLQNKYKNDILIPEGLDSGTGKVDFLTSKKLEDLYIVYLILNKAQNTTSTSAQISSNTQKIQASSSKKPSDTRPFIESASKTRFNSGETITLTGRNFADTNTVIVGVENDKEYKYIRSMDGKTLKVTISLSASDALNKIIGQRSDTQKDAIRQHILSNANFYGEKAPEGYVTSNILIENSNGRSNPITVSINL